MVPTVGVQLMSYIKSYLHYDSQKWSAPIEQESSQRTALCTLLFFACVYAWDSSMENKWWKRNVDLCNGESDRHVNTSSNTSYITDYLCHPEHLIACLPVGSAAVDH